MIAIALTDEPDLAGVRTAEDADPYNARLWAGMSSVTLTCTIERFRDA